MEILQGHRKLDSKQSKKMVKDMTDEEKVQMRKRIMEDMKNRKFHWPKFYTLTKRFWLYLAGKVNSLVWMLYLTGTLEF